MKIARNGYDWFADLFCVLLLAGVFIYLAFGWKAIPEQIPGHYNAAGLIDRWTDKKELFVLPIIALIMYVGITVLEQFPRIWNTGIRITKQNARRVYRTLKNMIATIKWQMVLSFIVITLYSSLAKPLPSWFTALCLILIFGTLIGFFIRLFKVR